MRQTQLSGWRIELENPYVAAMISGLGRALRFARYWRGTHKGLREEEVEVMRSDGPVPATLLHPPHSRPLPGWIVLHGITRPGRRHSTLVRFVRALAGSGAVVLVPEIPEWRELYLATDEAIDTIGASVSFLEAREDMAPGRLGAMGFSFGVPQLLAAAADPAIGGRIAAVAGFGGYCDLDRLFHFLFFGEHEWEGHVFRDIPDPYGRWVAGGNFLPKLPGFDDATDVADALLTLARVAGDRQIPSWEAEFDPLKTDLMAELHPSRQELFRAFAPPSSQLPPSRWAEELAPALARAIRESSPYSEPGPFLDRISSPVRLMHGREDRLIPFSESLRLGAAFPPEADVRVRLTGLFAHSRRDRRVRAIDNLRGQLHFLWIMTELLGLP